MWAAGSQEVTGLSWASGCGPFLAAAYPTLSMAQLVRSSSPQLAGPQPPWNSMTAVVGVEGLPVSACLMENFLRCTFGGRNIPVDPVEEKETSSGWDF